ncbi:MAG: HD domain-containing phosphohydrolase [Acidobacteriota bacterium]
MTGSSSPNILVVDNEPAIRAYLCDRLTQHAPYRCIGARDAREAIELTQGNGVDVAVLALTTPEDAGMRLAGRLRQQVPDLPIILITGKRSFNAAVEAMRIGVFDYLQQPFEVSELIDAIDRAAEWRRAAVHARRHPAHLQEQVADRTTRLSETFSLHAVSSSADLQSLLEILNQRRPETLAHARRVATLSVPLAATLGVEGPALDAIEQGALLHELGKIAIPDAVIHKPGPLTAAELALMRSHAQIGYDVAITVPCLRLAAELILAANERYDGTGYPLGLRGDAIPIGARVIAVVDAFDALTAPGASGDPVSIDRANAELVRGAGSRFDPDVVFAWLRFLDQSSAGDGVGDGPETWQ